MARIPDIMELLGAGGRGLDPSQLRKFLKAAQRNQYVDIGPYSAYLRKSHPRIVDPVATEVTKLRKPLDLANVQNTKRPGNMEKLPEDKRPPKGKFRDLMALLEDEGGKVGHDSVYVEQIQNEFLPELLDRMGYRLDKQHARMNPRTPSMYKRLSSS